MNDKRPNKPFFLEVTTGLVCIQGAQVSGQFAIQTVLDYPLVRMDKLIVRILQDDDPDSVLLVDPLVCADGYVNFDCSVIHGAKRFSFSFGSVGMQTIEVNSLISPRELAQLNGNCLLRVFAANPANYTVGYSLAISIVGEYIDI